MASAIGSAVTGFMQGQKHMDDRRRNKAIDNLLDRDAHEKDLEYASRRKKYVAEGGDPTEFPEFKNPAESDPYLVRGFNWLKEKFGSGGGEDDVALVEDPVSAPERQALPPVGSYGMQGQGGVGMYADGGKVDDEDETRPRRMAIDTDEPYVAQTGREAEVRPEPYMDKPLTERIVPNLVSTVPGVASDVGMQMDEYRKAEGPRAKGAAARGVAREALVGAGRTLSAATDDVLGPIDETAANFGRGVLGFLGFEGKRDNRQPDPQTPPPETVAGEPDPKAAAIQATNVGDEKPTSAVADEAIQAGVEMTPGHPDNPDQAFDWEEVAESGVRPEDIPPMTVNDWQEYRREMTQAAAMAGEDPQKVHMDITKMQMQGAQSNLQQAAFLLKSGNPRGAALAARAAFQYFPNGSDVRFGIYDGADGPVLVGMGTDEETGEPVGGGKPMMLTPDSIAAMAANFSNPTAFMTWTKDWHDMAQADREYNEITKPKAQADVNLAGAKTDYYRSGAEANRAEAANPSGGAKRPTEADLRASNETLRELAYEYGIEEEDIQDVMSTASWIRQVSPSQYSVSDDQIMKALASAYATGDFSQVERLIPPQYRQALPTGE